MNKCLGCGSIMQNSDPSKEGYVNDLNKKYCERCFRISHYNEYIVSDKNNSDYLKKIEEINKTSDLVIITLDFLNMFDIDSLKLNNPVLLVFTKRDIIPRTVNETKFLNNISCGLNVKDKLFISSKNNYNMDLLMDLIKEYKTSNNVYVIGLTNSGKSTLINKILNNYSENEGNITTSNLPSTTLDYVERKVFDDLFLIDTPGLLDEGSIINRASKNLLKKIVPKKEINPIIYQIKKDQSIVIDEFLRVDVKAYNNIIIYMSNDLIINRIYKSISSNLKRYDISLLDNQDLVIKGLGFIKFKYKCNIVLYLADDINYYVRNSIV